MGYDIKTLKTIDKNQILIKNIITHNINRRYFMKSQRKYSLLLL